MSRSRRLPIAGQSKDRLGQRRRVFRWHEQAVDTVGDRSRNPTDRSADHRAAERSGFDQHARCSFRAARHDQHVGIREALKQIGTKIPMAEKSHGALSLQRGKSAREAGGHSAPGFIAPRHDFQFGIGHRIQHAIESLDQQISSLFMADVAHVENAKWRIGRTTARGAVESHAQESSTKRRLFPAARDNACEAPRHW